MVEIEYNCCSGDMFVDCTSIHHFVDLGYFTEEMLDKSYFRWLYTALTRATKKLYLINL